jgi:hypothetical protein
VNCQTCDSIRLLEFNTELSEECHIFIGDHEFKGDLPVDIGLSDRDDMIAFIYCLDCGQIQDDFPLEPTIIESEEEPEEESD